MASKAKPQPDIDLGQPSTPCLSVARWFPSAPNGKSASLVLEPFVSSYNPRKQKHAALTPDNAAAVLRNSFDFDSLMTLLASDPEISSDRNALYAAMIGCAKDFEVG